MVKKELPRRVFKKGRKPLGKIARKVREKRAAQAVQAEEISSKHQFPNITRSITERYIVFKNTFLHPKQTFQGILLGIQNLSSVGIIWLGIIVLGLILILWQVVVLINIYPKMASTIKKRDEIAQQLKTWENIASKYPTYKDSHERVAYFAYLLGDKGLMLSEIEKVTQLDPNFDVKKEFGEK
ncbi:MAG TPA: hypothetical protein VF189_01410 [Patescibacteria group bacterium]